MYCKTCGTPANSSQKFCAECGSTFNQLDDGQTSTYRVTPAVVNEKANSASRGTFSKWLWGTFSVFLAVWIAVTFVVSQNYTSSPSPESKAPARTAPVSPTPSVEPESWFPKNYKLLTDDVAYRTIKNPECNIRVAHTCLQFYVVTNRPCKLFIRINHLVDGVVIDDSLDSVTVSAGQRGILTFASLKSIRYEGVRTRQVTEVNCY